MKASYMSSRGFVLALVVAAGFSVSASFAFAASGKGGGVPVPPPPPPVVATTTTTGVAFVAGSAGISNGAIVGSAPISDTYALVNTGTLPLVINSISQPAQVNNPFSLTTSGTGFCTNGMTLPTGTGTVAVPTGANVCLVKITLSPTTVGTFTTAINFAFQNAPALSLPIATQVYENRAIASIAPLAPLTVTDTPVLSSSIVGTILITSANVLPLTINSAAFTGPNAGDFVLVPIRQNPRGAGNVASCSGTVFPITLTQFGRCGYQIGFSPTAEGVRSATFTFTTNDPLNASYSVDLTGNALPEIFQPVLSSFNVSGLWGNPAEPDWSLSIAHHQKLFATSVETDAVVATFNTFDVNGAPTWYTIKNGSWTGTPTNVVTFSKTFTGEIHQTTGTYFAGIFDAAHAIDTVVGTATLSFTDASNGTLSYTINGVSGSKTITLAAF